MKSGFVSGETGPLPPWTDDCRRETVWRQSLSVTPLRCTVIDYIDHVIGLFIAGKWEEEKKNRKGKERHPTHKQRRKQDVPPSWRRENRAGLMRIGLFESFSFICRCKASCCPVGTSDRQLYSPSDIGFWSIIRLQGLKKCFIPIQLLFPPKQLGTN